ncbi:MAG: hypothetical protein R3224_01385, partial [Balneolaceae bacterium]|nr:hypothetical protein [Balneolaceae bacterium]
MISKLPDIALFKFSAREERDILGISLGILAAAALVITAQKFVRYGNAPKYDLFNSLMFNLITV